MSKYVKKSPKSKPTEGGDSDLSLTDVGEQQIIDITAVQLQDGYAFPLELDVPAEFQNILAAGVLHNSEYLPVYDSLCEALFEGRSFKLTTLLFWMVFAQKFQPKSTDIMQVLRGRVSKLYSKQFAKLPTPKEELANYLLFLIAYCIQIMYYNVFTNNRGLFNMRFILDIYHIIVFELHGIYVSDYYIQSSIEKIFGSKFFFYEQKFQKSKKSEVKEQKNEPLLRGLGYNVDNLHNVTGGTEFASELSSKLRDKKVGSGLSLPLDLDFPYSQQSLERTKGGSPGTVRKSLRKSQEKLEEEFPSHRSNLLEAQSARSASNKAYFPKIRFDCMQISPTVSKFLDNPTMSLPFRKKKLVVHSNNKHLAQFKPYDITSSLETILASKTSKNEKKQTNETQFQHYRLKNRPDDYALGYLPGRLRDKFKDEIDLKYILDNTGVYSMRSYTFRGSEENRKPGAQSSHYQSGSLRGSSEPATARNINQAERLPPLKTSTVLSSPPNPSGDPHESSLNRPEGDIPMIRNDSLRDAPLNPTSNPRDSVENNHFSKMSLLVDVPGARDRSKEADETTVVTTPLGTGLLRRLGKSAKKSNLMGKLSPGQPDGLDPEEDKNTHNNYTLNRMKLEFEDRSRNARRNEILDEDDQRHEARKNEKEFVYEDKRKHYMSKHSNLVSSNVDKNINELVTKLMYKQNVFSKNLTKYSHLGGK